MKAIDKFMTTLLLLTCMAIPVGAVNYYFDPLTGNNHNSGISESKPFKSLSMTGRLSLKGGDSILLKSGSVFSETLNLSCRGDENHPIVLGRYGKGALPYIKGDGKSLNTVHIINSENIVIRDLEISNKRNKPTPGITGILVELKDYGEARNTLVSNLYVHDVNGSQVIEDGGGIAICFRNGKDSDLIQNRFINLCVENCTIRNCERDAIKFGGYWIRSQWFPNEKVVIRNNLIEGVPGDGIVPIGCDGTLIEGNVLRDFPNTLPPSEACDGIWPWSCDNTLVQYNVVSGHKSKMDAYAYDSDWGCNNTVFQYNLSYNNDGGFLLVIGTNGWPDGWTVNGNIATQVRYNVSINDGLRDYKIKIDDKMQYFSPVISFTGYTKDTRLENNLFYMFPKKSPYIDRTFIRFTNHDQTYGKGDKIINNYFYASEKATAIMEGEAEGNVYEGNRYVGKLITPKTGFKKYRGKFDQHLWYDKNDSNWKKLIDFLKDKEINVNGKVMKVLDIIGVKE